MDLERLKDIRRDIDAVDNELLALFNRRAALSLEVGRLKAGTEAAIFDPRRETELLDALASRNPGPLPEEHLRAVWREILSSSRALQKPPRAAYLGPEGTFSYFAGLDYLGSSTLFEPCPNLSEVFRRVWDGACSLGVVPLENSLNGTVGQSFDLFFKYNVFIRAEFSSRISLCLLSNAASPAEVRTVYSHPQPLGQCGAWLAAHLPQAAPVPLPSTAAAAFKAAEEPGAAAIGHRSLSARAGLGVLASGIEDAPDNRTRFVLIASQRSPRRPGGQEGIKSSLLFTLPDKAGAPSGVLNLLAENGLNMRKLESRPMTGEAWKYVFFADVESDLEDPAHAPLVARLRETCTTFRILGSYPTGPRPDATAQPLAVREA